MGTLWALVNANPVIASAVIALCGVLLTVFVSRRTLYINSVTVERSKWNEKLRTNLSEFIGSATYLYTQMQNDDTFITSDEYKAVRKEVDRAAAQVKLQLNPDGAVDANLIELLDELPATASLGDVEYEIGERLLIRHAQWLLKEEWEKVKYEASGPLGKLVALTKRRRRGLAYQRFVEGEGSLVHAIRRQAT
jgi:hypothetical protein